MSWDKVWEDIFRSSEWGKYPSEDLIRFIARNFYHIKNRKDIKILEVGCGPGANLWYLVREGFDCYGIDGSVTAVERARKRILDELGQNLDDNIIVGDIINLPYADNYFDAIIDNEAVYANNWNNSKGIYQEIARCLKKNGKLFVRTFAEGTWGDTGLKEYSSVAEGPMAGKGFIRFTARNEIEELLEPVTVYEINLLIRTIQGIDSDKQVKEWLISAVKD